MKTTVAEIRKRNKNAFNIFFNCKSKDVIKGAIPEIEKKQNKLTCGSNPSEKYEQNKIKNKKK